MNTGAAGAVAATTASILRSSPFEFPEGAGAVGIVVSAIRCGNFFQDLS